MLRRGVVHSASHLLQTVPPWLRLTTVSAQGLEGSVFLEQEWSQ